MSRKTIYVFKNKGQQWWTALCASHLPKDRKWMASLRQRSSEIGEDLAVVQWYLSKNGRTGQLCDECELIALKQRIKEKQDANPDMLGPQHVCDLNCADGHGAF